MDTALIISALSAICSAIALLSAWKVNVRKEEARITALETRLNTNIGNGKIEPVSEPIQEKFHRLEQRLSSIENFKSNLNLITRQEFSDEQQRIDTLINDISTSAANSRIHIESGTTTFEHLRGRKVEGEDRDFIQTNRPFEDYTRVEYNGYLFSEPPHVVLSLLTIDIANNFYKGKYGVPINSRIKVSLATKPGDNGPKIGRSSCSVKAQTSWDSYIHKIEVAWIAYGKA